MVLLLVGFPNVTAGDADVDSALQVSGPSLSIGELVPRFPFVGEQSRGRQHHASREHVKAPFSSGLGTLAAEVSLVVAGQSNQLPLAECAVNGWRALAVPLLRYLLR